MASYRKRKKFEFNIYTYPASGSPNDLTPEHSIKKASSEHGARRLVLDEFHDKGQFVYSLELADTHSEGGQRVAC